MIFEIRDMRGENAPLLLLAGDQRLAQHGIKNSLHVGSIFEGLDRAGPVERQVLERLRVRVTADRFGRHDLVFDAFQRRAEYAGEHVRVKDMEGAPKPVQSDPPLMIGGGSRRVLRTAGELADIVSLNFDNSEGRIGAVGVGSGYAERTKEKIGWIVEGAGDRFDDIEIEIGAYFTVVTDDKQAALEGLSKRLGMPPEAMASRASVAVSSQRASCVRSC